MTSATLVAAKPPAVVEAFLRPALFLPDIRSRKKAPALEELVDALASAGRTRHPEGLLELLRQREALGSTAIGKGVAVPHARSTLVGERAVLVARSARGVEFEAPDEEPVHLLFLIVAPPMERDPVYLKLLAEIVRAVRLARVRRRLLDAPDFTSVRETLLNAIAD